MDKKVLIFGILLFVFAFLVFFFASNMASYEEKSAECESKLGGCFESCPKGMIEFPDAICMGKEKCCINGG